MMPEFQVSVIIPVYNAEKYLRQAVQSAVTLNEVGEVLLIEDKSPDNALVVCYQLANEFNKVKVLTHPSGQNMGAGASRNLGIQRSAYEYVAFLDADDWYLSNRFQRSKEIFESTEGVDGVYEATGNFYESAQELDLVNLTTVKKKPLPKNLLLILLTSKTGRFHTNAITIKKSIFEKIGLFDTSLRLHQDTHLWLRLAFAGNLIPGELSSPVAIRRVHSLNRIQHSNKQTRDELHIKTFLWFKSQENVNKPCYRILFNRYAAANSSSFLTRLLFTTIYLLQNPDQLRKLI